MKPIKDNPEMREKKPSQENQEWVIVAHFTENIEAHLAKSYLYQNGIEAHLNDEHMVSINPLYANALGGVKLLVPSEQQEEAEKLLNEINSGQLELNEGDLAGIPCPQCGSMRTQLMLQTHARGWRLALLLFSHLPLPYLNREEWQCTACHHQWPGPKPTMNLTYVFTWLILLAALVFALWAYFSRT